MLGFIPSEWTLLVDQVARSTGKVSRLQLTHQSLYSYMERKQGVLHSTVNVKIWSVPPSAWVNIRWVISLNVCIRRGYLNKYINARTSKDARIVSGKGKYKTHFYFKQRIFWFFAVVWDWNLHYDNCILNFYIHGELKMTNSFHLLLWGSEVYPSPLYVGWPCDLLWQRGCGRSDAVWLSCVGLTFPPSWNAAFHSVNKWMLGSTRMRHQVERKVSWGRGPAVPATLDTERRSQTLREGPAIPRLHSDWLHVHEWAWPMPPGAVNIPTWIQTRLSAQNLGQPNGGGFKPGFVVVCPMVIDNSQNMFHNANTNTLVKCFKHPDKYLWS